MHDRWTAVDTYLAEALIANDPDLEQALTASDAAGLPPISVSATHGKLLYLLAKLQGARHAAATGKRGGGPLRPDLHRRRQAEQPGVLHLGA
jgi:predicted O-methyltransferase YrrM